MYPKAHVIFSLHLVAPVFACLQPEAPDAKLRKDRNGHAKHFVISLKVVPSSESRGKEPGDGSGTSRRLPSFFPFEDAHPRQKSKNVATDTADVVLPNHFAWLHVALVLLLAGMAGVVAYLYPQVSLFSKGFF